MDRDEKMAEEVPDAQKQAYPNELTEQVDQHVSVERNADQARRHEGDQRKAETVGYLGEE